MFLSGTRHLLVGPLTSWLDPSLIGWTPHFLVGPLTSWLDPSLIGWTRISIIFLPLNNKFNFPLEDSKLSVALQRKVFLGIKRGKGLD